MARRVDVESMSLTSLRKEVTRLRRERDQLKEDLEDAIKKRNVMMAKCNQLQDALANVDSGGTR